MDDHEQRLTSLELKLSGFTDEVSRDMTGLGTKVRELQRQNADLQAQVQVLKGQVEVAFNNAMEAQDTSRGLKSSLENFQMATVGRLNSLERAQDVLDSKMNQLMRRVK